jgi:hypothetical protein
MQYLPCIFEIINKKAKILKKFGKRTKLQILNNKIRKIRFISLR